MASMAGIKYRDSPSSANLRMHPVVNRVTAGGKTVRIHETFQLKIGTRHTSRLQIRVIR